MSFNILWITSSFPSDPINGKNLYLYHPLQALLEMGVSPVVLNTQGWKPFTKNKIYKEEFQIKIQSFQYFSFPRHYFRAISNYIFLRSVVKKIMKLHSEHRFNIIHAHGEINGLAAVAAAKQLKIPAVVTIHGIDMCKRMWRGLAGNMFCKMLNETSRIIYVGEPLHAYFQHKINNESCCRIVHNGFRLPIDKKSLNRTLTDKKTIHVISVSNLHEGKGVDLTLLALAELKKKGLTDWKYTIIGDGDQRKLCEKIIAENGLDKHVILKGALPHTLVYEHLENSDIFCLPSYREAFGIAYVEAMSYGLLTIAVKGQGPEAFIENKKTGFLVEPKNVSDLVETLYFAFKNFSVLENVFNAGRKHVLENFTWEKHAEKLLSIYKEVSV